MQACPEQGELPEMQRGLVGRQEHQGEDEHKHYDVRGRNNAVHASLVSVSSVMLVQRFPGPKSISCLRQSGAKFTA